jgi:CRP/FNR family cyclic AMP-dependent transcriptional regulator
VVKSHGRERERKRPGETGSGVRQEEDRKETTVEVSKAISRCQNRGVITTAGQSYDGIICAWHTIDSVSLQLRPFVLVTFPVDANFELNCSDNCWLQVRRLEMRKKQEGPFDIDRYLASEGPGRRIIRLKSRGVFSSQGDRADSLFYLQTGRAKLTVVSKVGKEATVTLLVPGDFFGEECMAGSKELRTTTATAATACMVLKIDCEELKRVLLVESTFSSMFVKFIVLRGTRTQADLIDQLFNNSERRLARTLLLMADFSGASSPSTMIPLVTQETLADLIGTTRSRVSFFMNRFRKLGYISYKGRIRVHKSLLNVVLHDQLPEQNASSPILLGSQPSRTRTAKRTKLGAAPN